MHGEPSLALPRLPGICMNRPQLACRFLLLFVLALLLAACSTGPTVRSERDASAVFSGYATFGFFDPLGTDRAGYESLVTQALKTATRREMEARGYRYAESGADLLVNFNAQLAERTDVQPRAMPVPHPEYYGYRSYILSLIHI